MKFLSGQGCFLSGYAFYAAFYLSLERTYLLFFGIYYATTTSENMQQLLKKTPTNAAP